MATDEIEPQDLTIEVRGRVAVPADRVNEIGASLQSAPLGLLLGTLASTVDAGLVALLDAVGAPVASGTVDVLIGGGLVTQRTTEAPLELPAGQ
jgi:hypothetical protein